ncbi:MAG: hypothetical protein WBP81_10970 [Solirubrobacteraceae bacterium]
MTRQQRLAGGALSNGCGGAIGTSPDYEPETGIHASFCLVAKGVVGVGAPFAIKAIVRSSPLALRLRRLHLSG